jgi:hypothetical protein
MFGFNLADVGSADQLNAIGPGAKGLVWVGQCNGADEKFVNTVGPFVGNAKVFGFFLMDDPDPRGVLQGNLRRPQCEAGKLRAESDWIHARMPAAKTFIVLMNMSSSPKAPSFEVSYNPASTHVDLFGIDPYPCRTEVKGCDYEMIDLYVRAAEVSGVRRDRMIPVYQAFGGGNWADESGGRYTLPTPDQECQILSHWRRLLQAPMFDFAYSWGMQNGDTALEDASELREFFSSHNRGRDPC